MFLVNSSTPLHAHSLSATALPPPFPSSSESHFVLLDFLAPSPHSALHERPRRAAWSPRWERPLPPLPLAWCPQFQALQSLSIFSHSFPTTPFTSDLGMPPGCLGRSTRDSPLPG